MFVCIAIIVMAACGIVEHSTIEARKQENKAERDILVYQIENAVYEGDNAVGVSDLYNNISLWNSRKAKHDSMHDNIWIGMFYADTYEGLDYILIGGEK